MRLELTQKLQQHQVLAPQMILSMDILLLTAQELELRIEREFAENPALEIADPGAMEVTDGASAAPPSRVPDDPLFQKIASFEPHSSYRSLEAGPRRPRSDPDNDKHEMLQNTPGRPPGLKDHLLQQVHLSGIERRIQDLAEEIIQNLDHRGYLQTSEAEVFSSMEHRCSRAEFETALRAVRALDPPGIGAEDLRQCLLLQLERDPQSYPVETQIIMDHLEDLAQNRIPKIAKDIGTTLDEIKDAVDIIRSLDPIPGTRFEDEPTIYVRPEIIVEDVEGKLEVRLADGSFPDLTVSEMYRKVLKDSRGNKEVSSFLRKKIESAQWLIHAIHQRQRTLYDIALAVVEYQRAFMEDGPERLRAMRMQTIADIVGVHISTISRAIKGKYMQTPWGVYEFRYFFTGGVSKVDGEVESRRNVYRRIGEIIEKEDKAHPFSDSEIAEILKARGLDIARRTVTKYREQEKIPSSRLRRSF